MKNLLYLIPALIISSCSGSGDSSDKESLNDSLYSNDNERIVNAKELKEKLGQLQASFTEIGNKEVEETICGEGETVPYTGNKNEMNIWMMTTYMLDNFSDSLFAKNDFKMPDVKIKGEIPLRELDWLNFNSSDSNVFNLYRQYPDLTNIPKKVGNISNDEMLQNVRKVLKALEDGLFVVMAITDYVRPKYTSSSEFETGHLMAYILFADWKSGQLMCLTPVLAQNSSVIPHDLNSMYDDLQTQTYLVIDSIARSKTGFIGDVWVNNTANLENYND